MSEGNRSRCVKYDGSAVWKPAAAMERAARTALWRTDTKPDQLVPPHSIVPARPTTPPASYSRIERRHKIRHDGVGMVEAAKDRYDIRARIRVLFAQGGIEEDCQGLSGKRVGPCMYTAASSYLEGDFVGGGFGLLDADYGLAEQML